MMCCDTVAYLAEQGRPTTVDQEGYEIRLAAQEQTICELAATSAHWKTSYADLNVELCHTQARATTLETQLDSLRHDISQLRAEPARCCAGCQTGSPRPVSGQSAARRNSTASCPAIDQCPEVSSGHMQALVPSPPKQSNTSSSTPNHRRQFLRRSLPLPPSPDDPRRSGSARSVVIWPPAPSQSDRVRPRVIPPIQLDTSHQS